VRTKNKELYVAQTQVQDKGCGAISLAARADLAPGSTAPELVAKVVIGAKFVDGEEQTEQAA
jgi:hypothetical protein